MRDDSLSLSLLASCFIHGVVIILASIILKHTAQPAARKISCRLVLSMCRAQEQPKPIQRVETPPEIKKPPPPPPKVEKAKEPKPLAKSEIVQPKPTRRQLFPKKSLSSPSKRNPTETTKSEPTPDALLPGSKAAAAKQVLAIFSAKATWRLCRDRVSPVAAEAPLALVWAEDRVLPAFRPSH